jgi:hypothetical protein
MIIQPFGPYSYVWERLAVGGISAYGESLKPFGFAMNVAWEFVEYPDLRGGIDLVNGLEASTCPSPTTAGSSATSPTGPIPRRR